ncbi:transposase [Rhodococcus sp. USK13]|uniref:transposase n=1 Tax=Rhodococcus sp. USK13 TaxID=2806442 RepID=UPI0032D57531
MTPSRRSSGSSSKLTHKPAILRSAPGLGPVLAARVLGEIGDDPERFTGSNNLRSYAGTAPVTMSSGRSHYVKARKVRNKRLADACHW